MSRLIVPGRELSTVSGWCSTGMLLYSEGGCIWQQSRTGCDLYAQKKGRVAPLQQSLNAVYAAALGCFAHILLRKIRVLRDASLSWQNCAFSANCCGRSYSAIIFCLRVSLAFVSNCYCRSYPASIFCFCVALVPFQFLLKVISVITIQILL